MTHHKGLFKRILVPVDGSRFSLSAVEFAIRLARIHGSKLILIHVLDEAVLEQMCRLGGGREQEVEHEMKEAAKHLLKEMAQMVKEAGIDVKVALTRGSPHEAIVRESGQLKTDLIVMGRLGRRGVRSIMLGSVAERVVEFSEVPVLLV